MGIRGFRNWLESQFPQAIVALPKPSATTTTTTPHTVQTAPPSASEADRNKNNNNEKRRKKKKLPSASPVTATESTPTLSSTAEVFDHVLVDMNQFLHVALRKSRSTAHGLILLMKELDQWVLHTATPRHSLVLAMDGAPSAAKLATQRKRREAVVRKAQSKLQQLEKQQHLSRTPPIPVDTNITSTDGHDPMDFSHQPPSRIKRSRLKPSVLARKKRQAAAETRTLSISPGTEFMQEACQALQYWAWQRQTARAGPLSASTGVKIFISSSDIPGEGEVKLLEWIHHIRYRRGESIALIGGDSDLVLEALIIPPASSHNVFVLLPDGNQRTLSVSLWEMTRSLQHMLPPRGPPTVGSEERSSAFHQHPVSKIIKARTDLVFLFILNGNDYLPRLRGCGGFNRLFYCYLKLHRDWYDQGRHEEAYLVHPDTLEYNLDFAIEFFERLSRVAPSSAWPVNSGGHKGRDNNNNKSDRRTALEMLNNMVAAGFIPGPVKFKIIRHADQDEEEDAAEADSMDEPNSEMNEVDDYEDLLRIANGKETTTNLYLSNDKEDAEEETADEDQIRIRLQLGEPGTETFYTCAVWHPRNAAIKPAKHALAAMALADLMSNESDADSDIEDGDLIPDLSGLGYEWEIRHPVEGDVRSYLYGLLWNMQTYQDGVCADYAFNYGKRRSPAAKEIVEYFEMARRDGRRVWPPTLSEAEFTPALPAGLSCLAALPSSVRYLVPEPYNRLDDETVEFIYSSCMDPFDNRFDVKKFKQLCEEQIDAITDANAAGSERPIAIGDRRWVVISKVPRPLSRPYDPPPPFSERLAKLRADDRMRIGRVRATERPRSRPAWPANTSRAPENPPMDSREFNHSDPGAFLSKYQSVYDVPYIIAYQKQKERRGRKKQKQPPTIISCPPVSEQPLEQPLELKARQPVVISSSNDLKPKLTTDGLTAMACIKQLEDAKVIGRVEWNSLSPSTSADFKSLDSAEYELIRLTISVAEKESSGTELSYEQVREISNGSKQMIKQHLASSALDDFVGELDTWTTFSFKDLRRHIASKLLAELPSL